MPACRHYSSSSRWIFSILGMGWCRPVFGLGAPNSHANSLYTAFSFVLAWFCSSWADVIFAFFAFFSDTANGRNFPSRILLYFFCLTAIRLRGTVTSSPQIQEASGPKHGCSSSGSHELCSRWWCPVIPQVNLGNLEHMTPGSDSVTRCWPRSPLSHIGYVDQ